MNINGTILTMIDLRIKYYCLYFFNIISIFFRCFSMFFSIFFLLRGNSIFCLIHGVDVSIFCFLQCVDV